MMFRIICMGLGYEHESTFVIDRREGYPHYLALLVRTPCRLRFLDEIRSYPANTFVLYDMNVPQYYAADDVPYIDDWIQFESEPKIIQSFGLPLNTPIPMPDWTHPEQYFSVICSAFFRGFNNDAVINSLFTAMLTDYSVIPLLPDKPMPYFGELVALRQQIAAMPQKKWSAQDAADALHISVSYFHRIYHEAFRVSMTQDVIRSRIEAAKNLLQCTGLNAEEIAIRCGYASPEHFSRQFKKYTGVSPDRWRRGARAGIS
ncbi:MAG TPA: hypothetical protein DCG49_03720 [Ruminococcus sp.]|nr:hypothetical protein [Ruminococcus sp.]